MRRHKPGSGLTMLETLIVIGIIACIAIALFPAIQASRETARRLQCAKNMSRCGIAILHYEDSYRLFPPSSTVTRNAEGTISAVDGWSWMVLVLPYTEAGGGLSQEEIQRVEVTKRLYDTLAINQGRPLVEPVGIEGLPHADALATRWPGLLCPSFDGEPYTVAAAGKAAITNYKGSGATHIESLSVASVNPLTPKYNASGPHPDGVLFPGKEVGFEDIRKGSSNSILVVESVEQNFARWTVGAEASVVGLPRNVEFEERNGSYVPRGGGVENAAPVYWTYHTYLDTDCEKHPYDGLDGLHGGRFGPSSHHPTAVNHLLCDGSCRSLSTDIDVALYMFLIQRTSRSFH
jgi:hypothetical protein